MPRRNTFSWSVSRMKEFEACLRQYYWRRYGSWGGSRPDAEPLAREAYILKHLVSLPNYVGGIIHRTCARFWRIQDNGEWLSQKGARRDTIRALYAGVGESRRGGWRTRVSRGTHLFEHAYGGDLSEEQLEWARHRITESLAGFYNLDLVQCAGEHNNESPKVASIEKRERFTLAGVTVHLVMDLVVHEPDGGRAIWDWKSGGEREIDQFQVALYALYSQQAWDLPVDRLRMSVAYLQPLRVQEIKVTLGSLARTRTQAEDSIQAMQARLRSPTENLAFIGDFPMTDDLDRCFGCAFKRLCGRE
jgi:hypothetical protein